MEKEDILIYNAEDGKTSVTLLAKDGNVWMNQNQLAKLFAPLSSVLAFMLLTY